MLVALLLVLATVVGLVGTGLRARLAAEPSAADRTVLTADAVTAGVVTAILAAAAIAAWSWEPIRGTIYAITAVAAVVTAAATGSSVVRLVLAAGGIPTRADNHDDPDGETPLRGGRIIGVLERASVAACLLLAWPAGLAVILAVKSLARFSELRAPRASEQFILGTFASVMWACAVAGIAWLVGV